jgi:hypothetical protein
MDHMRKLLLAAGVVASLGALSAADVAGAQPYYHHPHHRYYHDYHRNCAYERHRSGAIGAVAGAVGGGIIGGAITHGRAGGTLLGAGAGALTGNALARHSVRC